MMEILVLKPSEDVNTGFQVSKMEPIYINLVSHLWLSLGASLESHCWAGSNYHLTGITGCDQFEPKEKRNGSYTIEHCLEMSKLGVAAIQYIFKSSFT